MTLDGIKNLYVLYDHLCGGMHLTHMLKMCPIFREQPHLDNYIEQIMFMYKTKIGHSSDNFINAHIFLHEHVDRIYKLVSKDSLLAHGHVNLLQGHIPNFHAALRVNMLRELGSYAGIVIESPKDKNSIVYQRIRKFEESEISYADQYTLPFRMVVNNNIFNLDYHNAILISSDKLFSDTGSMYVREIIKEKFNLELPQQADIIHDIWFKKVAANV